MIKTIPTPEERPDLYDGYDCAEREPLAKAYADRVTPDHVKKLIAERQGKKVRKEAAE